MSGSRPKSVAPSSISSTLRAATAENQHLLVQHPWLSLSLTKQSRKLTWPRTLKAFCSVHDPPSPSFLSLRSSPPQARTAPLSSPVALHLFLCTTTTVNTMSLEAWTHSTPPFPSTLARVPITPPTDLTPTQVLIQVVAAALNPVDVQLANTSAYKLAALKYPKALAADFSGKLLAKGSAVEHVKVGDEVYGMSLQAVSGSACSMVLEQFGDDWQGCPRLSCSASTSRL